MGYENYMVESNESVSETETADNSTTTQKIKNTETETNRNVDDSSTSTNKTEKEVSDGGIEFYEDKSMLESNIEFPTWISHKYIPPPEFETIDDKVKWYDENYHKAFDAYNEPEFVDNLMTKYEHRLAETEEKYDKLKQLDTALTSNPELMFKLYYPELLQQQGINPMLNEDQIAQVVHNKLIDEFGENYTEFFRNEDALKPNTISGKMYQKQNEIVNQLQTEQEKYKPISEEQIKQNIEKAYTEHLSDIPKEYYDKFVNQLGIWKPNARELFEAFHYKELVQEASKTFYEQGRQSVLKEIKNAGGKSVVSPPKVVQKEEEKPKDIKSMYSIRNPLYNYL